MATTDYPAGLPQPVGLSHEVLSRVFVSGLPGILGSSGRSRDHVRNCPVEFFFTAEQAEIFYQWWDEDLLRGGRWFNAPWLNLEGTTTVTAQFIGAPAQKHVYDGAYRITANVQVRSRALSVVSSFFIDVDVDAVSNGGATSVNAVAVTGLNPEIVYRIERPTGRLYTGYSAWPTDDSGLPPSTPNDQKWGNAVCVTKYPGTDVANDDDRSLNAGVDRGYATGEIARSAWANMYISGSAEYRFWIPDATSSDNRGGASLRVVSTVDPPATRSEAYRQAVLASSPIGYWLMSETSGSTVAAQVGTAGTIVGGVSLNHAGMLDRTRGCMKFNGVDGRIQVAQTALDRDAPLTVEAVLMKANDGGGAICGVGAGGWYVRTIAGRGAEFLRSQVASIGSVTGALPYAGTPFHFAMSFASGSPKTWRMYVNGAEVGSGTTSVAFSGYEFRIGCDVLAGGADTAPSTHWMQDVAIYNTELNAAAILTHAQAGGFA